VSAQHPSVWITNWLQEHGLSLDHAAAAMAKGLPDEDRKFEVYRVVLDMYVTVGPSEPGMHLQVLAPVLDKAFQRPAGFFAELEQKWIAGGYSKAGLPS
jgi:hypothetical protein